MAQTLTNRVEAILNTPGTGELAQISELNTNFTKLDNHFIPACKIHNSADQVVTSGSGQNQLLYNTTIIDTYASRDEGDMADLANDRIVIRKAGLYLLRANVLANGGTAGGILRLDMAINGTTNNSAFDRGETTATTQELWGFHILAVDDLITAFVQQTTGASRTYTDNTYTNIFNLEAIWLGNAVEV
jgi:hypothetical protein